MKIRANPRNAKKPDTVSQKQYDEDMREVESSEKYLPFMLMNDIKNEIRVRCQEEIGFVANGKDVKSRVESLIARGYLARMQTFRNRLYYSHTK
jgi:hypothetical protein